MENTKNIAFRINWILLGLVMLIPGLMKLFVMKPATIVGMFGGLGIPAASFFAWLVILSEIVFGVMILARWKLEYAVWPPIIILIVAAFTVHWANWTNMLVHLALASGYWVLGTYSKR